LLAVKRCQKLSRKFVTFCNKTSRTYQLFQLHPDMSKEGSDMASQRGGFIEEAPGLLQHRSAGRVLPVGVRHASRRGRSNLALRLAPILSLSA
jgi:hypothetical protein